MQLICRCILSSRTINKHYYHISVKLMNAKDSSFDSPSSDAVLDDNGNNKFQSEETRKNSETSTNQTIELLNNLLSKMSDEIVKSRTFRAMPKKIKKPKPLVELTLEERIISAAKETADALGDNKEKIRTDLIDKVFSAGKPLDTTKFDNEKDKSFAAGSPQPSLSELIAGMKIDRSRKGVHSLNDLPLSRGSGIQDMAKKFQERRVNMIYPRVTEKSVNLYDGERLNIFDKVEESEPPLNASRMETWNALEKKEFKLLLTHPPQNVYEEMIQWTERGLLWHFPINNEIGWEHEENISFSEHVFLEQHIQDWCPKKGPIRHFMELVCVGLSQNPYMTVQEKKDHIMWFRKYFADKQTLLKEIGAVERDIIPPPETIEIEV